MNIARSQRVGLMAAASSLALFAAPAFGQSTGDEGADADEAPVVLNEQSSASSSNSDAIIVTGTLIRGIAPVGAPVIPLSREDFLRTGAASTSEALQTIPSINSLGGNRFPTTAGTSQQNSRMNRGGRINTNLRGLGPQSTLVLVDGDRPAPAALASFDISAVPTAAVQRIEVVADGASATYGADAIAGVVNVILRRNFDGVEMSGQYRFFGEFEEYSLGGVVGSTWDTGSIMIAAEYTGNTNAQSSDFGDLYSRDLTEFGLSPAPTLSYPGNIVGPGGFYAIPPGQDGTGLTFGDLALVEPNRMGEYDNADISPRADRYSAVVALTQDITPGVRLDITGLYSQRDYQQLGGAITTPGNGLLVPANNPYSPCNPAKDQSANPGFDCSAPLSVQYAFTNDVGANSGGQDISWGATAELEVDMFGDWVGTASISRYVSDVDTYSTAYNATALAQALGSTVGGVAKPDSLPFFNPFCGLDTSCNDQATLDYFTARETVDENTTFDTYRLQFGGSLFDMPAGAVRLALGGEYREETLAEVQVNNRRTASVMDFDDSNQGSVGRDIKSVFGELYVPLLDRLSLNVAARYEDYSDFGSTTNPKVGLSFEPVNGLTLRGSWGTSFRAPKLRDIADTFGNRTTPIPIPAGAINLDPDLGFITMVNIGGGGGDVGPEEATTISLGFETTPELIPGLRTSINYFNYDYTGVITNPPLIVGFVGAVQSAPLYDIYLNYSPRYYPDKATMSLAEYDALVTQLFTQSYPPVTRAAPPPELVGILVDGRPKNAGSTTAEGIDFSINYSQDTSSGEWRIGTMGTWNWTWDVAPVLGVPQVDKLNKLSYPLRFVARAYAGATIGAFDVTGFLNYRNGYQIEQAFLPAGASVDQYGDIDAWTTFDLNIVYRLDEAFDVPVDSLSLSLNVQNLFDADAPFVLNGGDNTIRFDPANANPFGRVIGITLRAGL